MHALALLLTAAVAAAVPGSAAGAAADPGEGGRARPAHPPVRARVAGDPSRRPRENLLAGPARCVLRYLDAVRHAGPRPPLATRRPEVREKDYARARALTAPRTLEEIARRAASGEDHPLAPWREAARQRVLESFQLVAVRRAPRGAAVVTVKERFWRPAGAELERTTSEYLVARVAGEWRVVDRSPGRAFEDAAVAEGYGGFFDDPQGAR
jgi:hypothetical protein